MILKEGEDLVVDRLPRQTFGLSIISKKSGCTLSGSKRRGQDYQGRPHDQVGVRGGETPSSTAIVRTGGIYVGPT